ncbi:MAG: hypothetical protein ABJF10_14680 [Chthoniobacter sp.]|uniref:hypothetical protein n=1 Tax=Chthoniobacter sp. TaxID=2510640 RepID=UPI0032AB2BC4
MKHLLLCLAIIVGLTSLPTTTFAKDKRRDDDWKDSSKDLRNDLKSLQKHYDMVKDRVKNSGGTDRRIWGNLQDIRRNIDSLNDQVSNGRYDGRDVRNQIRRADDDLNRLQAQLEYNSKRKGGYYRN